LNASELEEEEEEEEEDLNASQPMGLSVSKYSFLV